jgi:hypothetical protein
MTREDAIVAARMEAERTGRAQTVHRFPAWRKDVYGVRASDQLPKEALTFETIQPGQPIAIAPVVEPVEQGSLF